MLFHEISKFFLFIKEGQESVFRDDLMIHGEFADSRYELGVVMFREAAEQEMHQIH